MFEPIQQMSFEKLVTLALTSVAMTLILSIVVGASAGGIITAIRQPPPPPGFEGPCVDSMVLMGDYGSTCEHSNHVSTIETDEAKRRWFRCTCARPCANVSADGGAP